MSDCKECFGTISGKEHTPNCYVGLLESEHDRLKFEAGLFRGEIERLKAELEDEKQSFQYRGELLRKCQKDRDLWKSKCEHVEENRDYWKREVDCQKSKAERAERKVLKLAEFIKEASYYDLKSYEKAKAALAEFNND